MESFEAVIQEGRGGGAYVEVPANVVNALGGRGRIAVRASFNGVDYQGAIVSMGSQQMILGLLKGIRTQLGKAPGDRIQVTVEADTAPRRVEVPDDLASALKDAGLRDRFDALSYTRQREHVIQVEEAKRPETRERRIRRTIEQLQSA